MARLHDAFPSDYMKASDLLDEEGNDIAPVINISSIKTAKMPDGEQKRAVTFDYDGRSRTLTLNKTNWKNCALISGNDPETCDDEKFVGLDVQLVRKYVEYRGDMVPGIRVQPVGGWDGWKPNAKAAAAMAKNDAFKETADEPPF